MKTHFINLVLLVLSTLVWNGCKKNTVPSNTAIYVPEVETMRFRDQKGTDCDSVYEDRTNCAYIDFDYPVVTTGTQALKDSVAKYVNGYLIGILTGGSPEENVKAATLEEGAKVFFATHETYNGSAMYGAFTASSGSDVVRRDSQYLSIAISGNSFQGGAHGSQTSLFATLDSQTGRKLTWDDVVKDKAAMLSLAERYFRKERAEIFTNGFDFDETFPFALPRNFALIQSGIYLQYDPYEVAPYAMGSSELMVPFSEIGDNLKLATAASSQQEDTGSAEDLFEIQGGQVVVPTFEIEVRTSARASQLLQKKKETIIVAAMFYGFPSDPKDEDETGQMGLMNKDIELSGNQRLARFEGLKFSKTELDKLKDKDFRLLINVYSGRKSSEDNLLSCGLAEVPASQFRGKRYSIQCNLIEESPNANDGPTISYALPSPGESTPAVLPLSVDCNERGELFWLGNQVKDIQALMANLRPVLEDLQKNGAKQLPGIQTNGCMMGTSGAVRDEYEALKNQLAKPTKTAAPAQPSTEPGKVKTSAKSPAPVKAAPASSSTTPAVTLNPKGEITLNGKKVALENLRKELQAALLRQATIPDKLDLKTTGETGMGMRGEVRTVIDESIDGAKWVRKKAAIEAMNAAVGKKLKTPTQLELASYQASGNFAYISARPKQADGKAIDYSKTDYAKDSKGKPFADHAIGLLKYENNAWKLLAYNIGVNTPPIEVWVKNYKAPKALFGNGQ
ncbi:MAG: DUF3298 domain-containing protein [Lewinellaceae bacterium]|nr:DUF3298 domain-containing protein [Saprospiraceae bacterium]MCB9337247.1 DUF3298 domain-containing protein [Lewinellaceae bacterium]